MIFDSWTHDNLYLHSFPTRRSSDLSNSGARIPIVGVIAEVTVSACGGLGNLCLRGESQARRRLGARAGLPSIGPLRSEEHTSELQSHSDLVCRLLLEKKKKYEYQAE